MLCFAMYTCHCPLPKYYAYLHRLLPRHLKLSHMLLLVLSNLFSILISLQLCFSQLPTREYCLHTLVNKHNVVGLGGVRRNPFIDWLIFRKNHEFSCLVSHGYFSVLCFSEAHALFFCHHVQPQLASIL